MAESSRPVYWSPEALADLHQIWDHHFEVAGQRVADNILNDIGRIVAVISEHPHSGRSRDEIRPSLRSLAATPYVIFYRVTDRPQIVRVLDGRRDIEEIFSDPSITPPE